MRYVMFSKILILSAAATLGGFGAPAAAQESKRAPETVRVPVSERSIASLEEAFWACDYAATTYGVINPEALRVCGMVSHQLKAKKFDGDFTAMLSWWSENKTREHKALAAVYGAPGRP